MTPPVRIMMHFISVGFKAIPQWSAVIVLLAALAGCGGNTQHHSTDYAANTINVFKIPPADSLKNLRVHICPVSKTPVRFYLTPANVDFKNYTALVSSLFEGGMSDKEKAFVLWQFMVHHTARGQPASHQKHLFDPLKLLNTYQSGKCDNLNAALANLAQLAGLQSRVYHLQGHVVAEIFYNNQWHMFDAFRDVVYTDGSGEVVDVAYISSHPQVIDASQNPMRSNSSAGRGWLKRKLKKKYSSVADNKVDDWYQNLRFDYRNEIILQPGEEINFYMKKRSGLRRALKEWYLVSGKNFDTEGKLKRKITAANSVAANAGEVVVKENSPYAITNVQIQSLNFKLPDAEVVSVFYSPDSTRWFFKGMIQQGVSGVGFNTFDAANESTVFSYYLKFVSANKNLSANDFGSVSVVNTFLFSDKIFFNDAHSFKLVADEKAYSGILIVSVEEEQ